MLFVFIVFIFVLCCPLGLELNKTFTRLKTGEQKMNHSVALFHICRVVLRGHHEQRLPGVHFLPAAVKKKIPDTAGRH